MANEYIERATLLHDIEESVVLSVGRNETSAEMRGANKIVDRIRCAPAADVVEVVHGRWVERKRYDECSICGEHTWFTRPNYCPNCGAKMDGGA